MEANMKKLATVIALSPTTLLAHGGHAPVPEATHGMAHLGVNLGLSLIALAVVVGLVRRFRS